MPYQLACQAVPALADQHAGALPVGCRGGVQVPQQGVDGVGPERLPVGPLLLVRHVVPVELGQVGIGPAPVLGADVHRVGVGAAQEGEAGRLGVAQVGLAVAGGAVVAGRGGLAPDQAGHPGRRRQARGQGRQRPVDVGGQRADPQRLGGRRRGVARVEEVPGAAAGGGLGGGLAEHGQVARGGRRRGPPPEQVQHREHGDARPARRLQRRREQGGVGLPAAGERLQPELVEAERLHGGDRGIHLRRRLRREHGRPAGDRREQGGQRGRRGRGGGGLVRRGFGRGLVLLAPGLELRLLELLHELVRGAEQVAGAELAGQVHRGVQRGHQQLQARAGHEHQLAVERGAVLLVGARLEVFFLRLGGLGLGAGALGRGELSTGNCR